MPTYQISGVTRDVTNNLVGSCEVFLLKYNSGTHLFTQVAHTTSNASTGAYTFTGIADNDPAYNIVAFKDGVADMFDCSDRTIVPTLTTTTGSWNPLDLTNVTLSNGNMTMLASASLGGHVRSTTSHSTGRYYFEMTMDVAPADYAGSVGFALGSRAFDPNTYNVGPVMRIINGVWYDAGTNNLAFIPQGETLGFILDLDTSRVWFACSSSATEWATWSSLNAQSGFPTGYYSTCNPASPSDANVLTISTPVFIYALGIGSNVGGVQLGVTLNLAGPFLNPNYATTLLGYGYGVLVMSFTLGTYGLLAADPLGWTTFTNPSIKIYVSDTYGTASPADPTNFNTPFKTIQSALDLIYNTANWSNFWILLAKGDTFVNQGFGENMAGGDATTALGGALGNPCVYGCYDPFGNPNVVNPKTGAARPIVISPPNLNYIAGIADRGYLDRSCFVGIDFYYRYGDPDYAGFTGSNGNGAIIQLNSFDFMLIEDCRFRFTGNPWDGSFYHYTRYGPLWFRRNVCYKCVPNGMHAMAKGFHIHENCFVHNGWNSGAHGGTSPSGFIHQVYLDGMMDVGMQKTIGWATGDQDIKGNIFIDSPDDCQLRDGGTIDDNCFITSVASHNYGNPNGNVHQIVNNVHISPKQGPAPLNINYLGIAHNVDYKALAYAGQGGSTLIANNIFANSKTGDNNGYGLLYLAPGSDSVTVRDNILYNWSPGYVQNTANSNQNAAIQHYVGAIKKLSIVNGGSGYVDRYFTINGISRNEVNNVIIHFVEDVDPFTRNDLDQTGNPWTVYPWGLVGVLWMKGLQGDGQLATLNDVPLTGRATGRHTIELIAFGDMKNWTEIVPGSVWTPGGTQRLYYAYRGTGAAVVLTGGSGTGGSGVAVVAGGKVVSWFWSDDSEGPEGAQIIGSRGQGYLVNNQLSISNTQLGGSGSGCVLNVDSISVNTIGTNLLDAQGTNAHGWSNPTRNAESYAVAIGLTGTTDALAAALADRNKMSANFDALSAVNGVNKYIRNGFDLGVWVSGVFISQTTLPNGTTGIAYPQTTLLAGGGTGPYTFAVTAGALPTGLNLTNSGLLNGTPTIASTFSFSITATDSLAAQSPPQAYSVIIQGAGPPPPQYHRLLITVTPV